MSSAADTVSAGHLLVAQLEAAGIPRVYAVPGESYLDVLDGLHASPIRTVVARHEGGAGFMALAEGRLTDRPGVAMVTRGPGAANAFIAVHTAYQDATPLVLFIGLVPVADRGRESFQEFDPAAWFGSTAKKVLVLEDPAAAARVVDEALHTAASGRPGPVVVGLPEDLLVRQVPARTVPPRPVAAPVPDDAALARLADLLRASRRPLLVAGGEGWTAQAADAVAGWAAARGIPVATDFRAFDSVPHASEAYVGGLGYGRAESTAACLEHADLLLFVGCVRSDVLSDGYRLGGSAVTVVVNPDPELLGHDGRVDLQVTAGPAAFAAALPRLDALPGPAPAHEAGWLKSARAAWETARIPAPDTVGGVDLGLAMAAVEARKEPDAILTFGAGNHTGWAGRFLSLNGPDSLVGPRNGAMGAGIPAAVAASLAYPDRQVISVAGDGCFLMNAQEIATAVAAGARFTAIVVDNAGYGTIKGHQEQAYPGRPSGTDLVNPDFAAWAQSFGGYGERVEHTDDFPAAFERAAASGRPAVLHVIQDPAVRAPLSQSIPEERPL